MTNSKALDYLKRGIQKTIQEDYFGAIDDFTNAISIDSSFTEAYIKRAQAKCATEEISQILDAFSDYDSAVRLDPNNAEALEGRGSLMAQLNPENPEGLSDLEKAAKIDSSASSYWNLGIAKLNIDDFQGALKAFQNFIELEKPTGWQLAEGYYFIGVIFQNLNEWEKAINSFSKAISNKATINYYWAFYNRAESYCQVNKFDEALKDYMKVIELKPDLVDTYINRSKLFLKKNLVEEAIHDLKTALSYEKDNIKIIEELAMQLYFEKDFIQALEHYSKLIQLQPDSAHHYQNRGVCLLQLKKYEQSILDFNKSIKLNSSRPYAYYYRGLSHFYLNNEQACEDWKIAFDNGCEEAKPWMDKYCMYDNKNSIEIAPGLWVSLDDIESESTNE